MCLWFERAPDSSDNLLVFVKSACVCVGRVADRGHLAVLFRKTNLPKDEWVNRNH